MKRILRAAAVLALVSASLLAASCSDILLEEMDRLMGEESRAAILPRANTIIAAHENITLTFQSAMDPGSVRVSGDIAASAPQQAWSEGNTVLNLNPSGSAAWSPGGERTLKISVEEGGRTISFSYDFEVFAGFCVAGGSGSSDETAHPQAGTQRRPFATIAAALNNVEAKYPSGGQVRVAPASVATTPANEYQINYYGDPSSRIIMKQGYSLYGGYSRDWTGRNAAANRTVIRDLSTTGSSGDPARGVGFTSSSIDASTVLDGVIIIGSVGGDYSTAVFCMDASPTISNCVLTAGGSTASVTQRSAAILYGECSAVIKDCDVNTEGNAGSNSVDESYGVYIETATGNAVLRNNRIAGGLAESTDGLSAAVYCIGPLGGSLTIKDNEIRGGSAYAVYGVYGSASSGAIRVWNNLILSGIAHISGTNYGIYASGAHPVVRNNTIRLGNASSYCNEAYGIYLNGITGNTVIDNNLLICLDGSSDYDKYGVYESGGSSDTASLTNNCFHNFPDDSDHFLYRDENTTNITNITTLNGLTDAAGNIGVDPVVGTDFRLGSGSPASVTRGGRDGDALGWGFSTDKDGRTRTENGATGWSMGCYEYD